MAFQTEGSAPSKAGEHVGESQMIWFSCDWGVGQSTREVFSGLVDIPLKVSLP